MTRGELPKEPGYYCFGKFILDNRQKKLLKRGIQIDLQAQPLTVLTVLLENPGQVVTREMLRNRLWAPDVHVDLRNSLGVAIRKIREALGDNADEPQFVETLTGPISGFRFKAPVTVIPVEDQPDPGSRAAEAGLPGSPPQSEIKRNFNGRTRVLGRWATIATLISLAALVYLRLVHPDHAQAFSEHDQVLLCSFENHTKDPQLGDALLSAFGTSLQQSRRIAIFPEARLSGTLKRMGQVADPKITQTLGREICQREAIRGLISGAVSQIGHTYMLSAAFIEPGSGRVLAHYSEQASTEAELMTALNALVVDVRKGLGESWYQVRQADKPLPEVTTPSLVALKAYSHGQHLWRQGRYQESVAQFNFAVSADPNFAMAHAALGNMWGSYIGNRRDLAGHEYSEALRLSSRATDRERMAIQVSYVQNMNHSGEVEGLLRAYLRLYPDDWSMGFRLAQFLRDSGRCEEAISEVGKLSRLASDEPNLYIELATCYSELRDYSKAIPAYEKAFQLEPNLNKWSISQEYGFTLVANGEERRAEQFFGDRLRDRENREISLRSLGILDVFHGRLERAGSRFAEALVDDLASGRRLSAARVNLWLAYVAGLQSNGALQAEHLQEANKLSSEPAKNFVFAAWVGVAYARAGAPERSKQILGMMSGWLDPQDQTQNGYLHVLQGAISTAGRDFSTAHKILLLARQEHGEHGQDPWVLEAQACNDREAGMFDDAIASYEQLLALEPRRILWEPLPEWLTAHYRVAQAYIQRGAMGDRGKARASLDKLLAFWKDGDQNIPILRNARALRATLP